MSVSAGALKVKTHLWSKRKESDPCVPKLPLNLLNTSAEFTRIPNDLKEVTPDVREVIDKMVDRLEDFEDVQNVYTNMKPAEEE